MIERFVSPQQLAARYDRVASAWPRLVQTLGIDRAYQQLLRELALPLGATPHALDCGVGAGDLSLAFAATASAPSLVGVDLSEHMLEVARVRLEKAGFNATLLQTDAAQLPFAAATFDIVLCAHMLEHSQEPQKVLEEIRRVLKPAAPLVLVITRRSPLGLLLQGRWPIRLYTRRRLETLLYEAGFTRLRILPLPGAWWCRAMSFAALGWKHG